MFLFLFEYIDVLMVQKSGGHHLIHIFCIYIYIQVEPGKPGAEVSKKKHL